MSDEIKVGAPGVSALEAILFAAGDYVKEDDLMASLGITKSELLQLLEELDKQCEGRGIKLVKLSDAYQLCTRAEYYDYVQKATAESRSQGLSPAAMEVLAIVAYKQPVTKSQIDYIRGVDSTSPLGRLVANGMVESVGKLDAPGRPTLYATTRAFLRTFGLTELSGLPDIGSFEVLSEITQQTMMDIDAKKDEELTEDTV